MNDPIRTPHPKLAVFINKLSSSIAEAKNSGSGVKDTSRLISRLLYRQFGIFVTTSYVAEQAYREITEDLHPVLIVTGQDLANILIHAGCNSEESVFLWLKTNFPS